MYFSGLLMGIGDWEIGLDFEVEPDNQGIDYWFIEIDFEVQ